MPPTTVSLVTPCLNSAGYLQQTIDSVTSQRGEIDLEYIVVDGGSDDGTIEIIAANEPRLAWWTSEPDDGVYEAILKGLEHARGDIIGWVGSDDLLFPGTLDYVARAFAALPEMEWLSTLSPTAIDTDGDIVMVRKLPGFSREAFLDGVYVGFGGVGDALATEFIQQESTFWRRPLWERIDPHAVLRGYRIAGDFALWCAFFAETDLHGVQPPLGAFRLRPHQLSLDRETYLSEVGRALSELRRTLGHDGPDPDADARSYTGLYVSKGDPRHPSGDWHVERREFSIVPRGLSAKDLLFDSRIG
jgi:glycosyltransferase involved in cell wall biosynthesis